MRSILYSLFLSVFVPQAFGGALLDQAIVKGVIDGFEASKKVGKPTASPCLSADEQKWSSSAVEAIMSGKYIVKKEAGFECILDGEILKWNKHTFESFNFSFSKNHKNKNILSIEGMPEMSPLSGSHSTSIFPTELVAEEMVYDKDHQSWKGKARSGSVGLLGGATHISEQEYTIKRRGKDCLEIGVYQKDIMDRKMFGSTYRDNSASCLACLEGTQPRP